MPCEGDAAACGRLAGDDDIIDRAVPVTLLESHLLHDTFGHTSGNLLPQQLDQVIDGYQQFEADASATG